MRKHSDMATRCCSLLIGALVVTVVYETTATHTPNRTPQNKPMKEDTLPHKSAYAQVNGYTVKTPVESLQDGAV
jgi:hypothetical protein